MPILEMLWADYHTAIVWILVSCFGSVIAATLQHLESPVDYEKLRKEGLIYLFLATCYCVATLLVVLLRPWHLTTIGVFLSLSLPYLLPEVLSRFGLEKETAKRLAAGYVSYLWVPAIGGLIYWVAA